MKITLTIKPKCNHPTFVAECPACQQVVSTIRSKALGMASLQRDVSQPLYLYVVLPDGYSVPTDEIHLPGATIREQPHD